MAQKDLILKALKGGDVITKIDPLALFGLDISSKKFPNTFALIDREDYDRVKKYNWYFCQKINSKNGYVVASDYINKKSHNLSLSRFIMNCPKGLLVDHRDHNTLNNQKYNLRICNSNNNNWNMLPRKNCKSKHKGVFWNNDRNKWTSRIQKNEKIKFLGRFSTQKEAAIAYNKAAKELHGEFAYENIV